MSYLHNDPANFVAEMTRGFVAANSQFVRQVTGGVVRATRTPPGEVAVVIGGGSGHYPAFAGLVGQGLAHGAAMGEVFASPSAHQIYSVAKVAAGDAGVLFSYGNYAGDVLNFDQAQERLIAEGIPCRTVVVIDDVLSADKSESHKRRGIAGDLPVFRAAAWAAEQGRSLDDVWACAENANQRTRSLGVAFSGCTLPGADHPLFTIEPGRMGVGMGIHGEPGIEEQAVPSADELGVMLVDGLLDDLPDEIGDVRGARVGLMLNGLGSVKYEELFVTYNSVAKRLAEAGVEIVQPEVGELVTSFEMAGVSLTLCWLDEEFEQGWTSPAATPAYRRGSATPRGELRDDIEEIDPLETAQSDASTTSQGFAPRILAALEAVKSIIDEKADELGDLDSIAGDGDHGIGMQRGASAGLAAAKKAVDAGAGAGTTLMVTGDAWADRGAGTSGALWGLGLRSIATAIGDENAIDAATIARGVADAAESIARHGKAEIGDKTMLDSLFPFKDKLAERIDAGQSLAEAWQAAAQAATQAAEKTADLKPRMGRARPHAEKSIGTPDPGAISLAMIVTAVGSALQSND